MKQIIKNVYGSAARKAVNTYRVIAFVCTIVVFGSVLTGQHSGYAQVTLPFGAALGTVSGDEIEDGKKKEEAKKAAYDKKKADKAKAEQHAEATPQPGHKPALPNPPNAAGIVLP